VLAALTRKRRRCPCWGQSPVVRAAQSMCLHTARWGWLMSVPGKKLRILVLGRYGFCGQNIVLLQNVIRAYPR
jgi:hypothetical protein